MRGIRVPFFVGAILVTLSAAADMTFYRVMPWGNDLFSSGGGGSDPVDQAAFLTLVNSFCGTGTGKGAAGAPYPDYATLEAEILAKSLDGLTCQLTGDPTTFPSLNGEALTLMIMGPVTDLNFLSNQTDFDHFAMNFFGGSLGDWSQLNGIAITGKVGIQEALELASLPANLTSLPAFDFSSALPDKRYIIGGAPGLTDISGFSSLSGHVDQISTANTPNLISTNGLENITQIDNLSLDSDVMTNLNGLVGLTSAGVLDLDGVRLPVLEDITGLRNLTTTYAVPAGEGVRLEEGKNYTTKMSESSVFCSNWPGSITMIMSPRTNACI